MNDNRLSNTGVSSEEDRLSTSKKKFKEMTMFVCNVSLDHNVEEGLLLDKLELSDFLRPGLETVFLLVEVVIEHSESSWVLGGLELLTNCGVKVVFGLV